MRKFSAILGFLVLVILAGFSPPAPAAPAVPTDVLVAPMAQVLVGDVLKRTVVERAVCTAVETVELAATALSFDVANRETDATDGTLELLTYDVNAYALERFDVKTQSVRLSTGDRRDVAPHERGLGVRLALRR